MGRRRVLVTRSPTQAAAFVGLLQQKGFEVLTIPTIEIVDPASWKPVDQAIEGLEEYDAIVFTSVNAVKRFLGRLSSAGALGGFPVYAVGEKTAAALEDASVAVAGVPSEHRAEGLADLLEDPKGKRYLLPRALDAREVLPTMLREAGAIVDVVAVYRTEIPSRYAKDLHDAIQAGLDCVTFLSGSAARGFRALAGEDLMRSFEGDVAVIGPVTAEDARAAGLEPTIEAAEQTAESLAEAIAAHFA